MIDILGTLLQNTATAAQTPFPWGLIIAGFISSGIITTALNLFFTRRKTNSDVDKTDADAADVIQKAAGELIKQVREQAQIAEQRHIEQNRILMSQNQELSNKIGDLQRRLPELEHTVAELTKGVNILTQQLKENNIQPVFPPVPPAF